MFTKYQRTIHADCLRLGSPSYQRKTMGIYICLVFIDIKYAKPCHTSNMYTVQLKGDKISFQPKSHTYYFPQRPPIKNLLVSVQHKEGIYLHHAFVGVWEERIL